MGVFIISMFAIIGICIIAGILTRNTDGTGEDKDNVFITFIRGMAVVVGITTILGFILGILSLFIDFGF